jgi:hypothetical protein
LGESVYTTTVAGYNILSGLQTYGPISVPGGPDGMGVISGGALSGDIVANTNGGEIYLLDALGNQTSLRPADHAVTLPLLMIATVVYS